MPMPAPPKRACSRYSATGTLCTTPTARADGWCGVCDGYTVRAPREETERRQRWHWGPGPWHPAPLGLETDEAYEIEIHPHVVRDYSSHHTVPPKTAVVQIRSLLEDLITSGAPTEADVRGRRRIYLPQGGYGLMLSQDRGTVVRYCTRHAERTWAQYRGGVHSRISTPNRGTAWQRAALAEHLPVKVTATALHGYTRHVLGTKITRGNIDDIARRLAAHLNEYVLPKWDRTADVTLADGQGSTWVLAVDDRSPEGVVVANYATGVRTEE
ncbi:hypothetical protein ACFY8C_27270 [Streptomyces flavochromogenes]|uniref:Integrase n=1 Tax=Streptomyces flavochromogenes TaxID=68199 RepID=A0ABW6XXG9_9ACTN|nr:hypothetical protein [Streptomyces flavochromogenes]